MIRRLVFGFAVVSALFFLASCFTSGTHVEVDLDSGRTRTTKGILGQLLPVSQQVRENRFSELRLPHGGQALTGTPVWRTAQRSKWWRGKYSPQYEFSWVLRMVRELSYLVPLLEESSRGFVKMEFLTAVAQGDYDSARAVVEAVRKAVAEKE